MTTTTLETAELAQLELLVEDLEEALVDAQLAADDRGWSSTLGDEGTVVTREAIRQIAARARMQTVVDPLIRRAVNLRIAYVWGSGLTIGAADSDGEGGQDVNGVVQDFLADQAHTFGSPQAAEERERSLMTAGNVFLALPTDPVSGRVQVRRIPDTQVDDIETDPQDVESPWFYKRTYTATEIVATAFGTTSKRQSTKTVYYPALGFWPARRPRSIDGHEVLWDSPVLHVRVNRPDGSKWGTSDLWAALDWASGYKDFLVSWARLVKALSQFAFRATAASKKGGAHTRERLTTAQAGDGVGGTVITAEGQRFEAIGKSGATIDSESGRPLAAMVAAGTDLPVTMLLADPGQTGARATAETLDKPLALVTEMRRALDGDVILRVLDYVVDQAIKAPRGPLRGTRKVDQLTGKETYALAGDQSRGLFVDWPSLEDMDVETLMRSLKLADEMGQLPELVIARLTLQALHVDDVDSVLEQITDPETGEFMDPRVAADTAAVSAAIRAFQRGDDPAAVLR